ncbi:MAG TPA: hypothetical protein PLQ49_07985 [Methanothrix sp.]|nr:hypothetical protein [Methanothrix sp.]
MTSRFEEEIGLIKKAVVDFWEGHRSNLAIVSDPFYGESELMDRVEGMAGMEGARIDARSIFSSFEALEKAPGRIVMVEEAHRLYCRNIGGFDTLIRFLEMMSSSDRLFITTWNSVSWRYLDEVLGLGRYFSKKVSLPKMGADEIRDMLISGYDEGELTFVEEVSNRGDEPRILHRRNIKKSLMGRSLDVPVPVVEIRSIRSRMTKNEKKSPEDIFFEKLARISDGNPGVAEHLWEEALDYPKVMDRLRDPPSIDLGRDDSFALSIILSMGSLNLGEISEVLKPHHLSAERIVGSLEEQRLIHIEGDVVSVSPDALKGVMGHLGRLRLVW